ncbi:MAG: NTP transferase domain-containing protein [Candidatus Omnitrophica bacterium]|nr:NTP transferase domain-containing protein [Candidatus Omnitrophota bacterium]
MKQAVILAGGRGSRLGALTDLCPKPMVMVNGYPFLRHLILMLKDRGISDIVILVGYLGGKIMEYFSDGSTLGLTIRYSSGAVDMETGTRLKNAAELLEDKFLLLYCDNYWPLDLDRMTEFYDRSGALFMTTVYNNTDGRGEYGYENNIMLDKEGFVVKYDKQRREKGLNGVDIGFFVLDKKILEFIPDGNISFEKDVLPVIAAKRLLAAYRTDAGYYYITTERDLTVTAEFLSTMDITTK